MLLPIVKISANEVSWQNRGHEAVFKWAFYWKNKKGWNYEVFSSEKTSYQFQAQDDVTAVAVVGIDRLGNESKPVIRNIK